MILIGTDSGIYRWYEGCGWPIFHSLQGRSIVALDSPGAGELVALERSGALLESLDNGQSWRTLPLAQGAGTPTALTVGGTPASILLATRRSLGLSLRAIGEPTPRYDSGRRFSLPFSRKARSPVEGGTRVLAPGGRVVHIDPVTIRQQGWTPLNIPSIAAPGHSAEVRFLAMGSEPSPAWFAAVRHFGLWRSTDEGTSWQQCASLPPIVNAVRTIPSKPGSVVAATANGCWLSTDSGRTWEDRSGGLESRRYVSAVDVKPGAPDVMLAGVAPQGPDDSATASYQGLEFSLYETTNGGKSWTIVRRGNPDVLAHDSISDIRHDPAAPDNAVLALASGELWLTRNGGAYWSPLARQIRATRVLCAAV